MLHLERNDYGLIAGLGVASLVVGYGSMAARVGPQVEPIIDAGMLLALIAGVVSIYKARALWGGEVARGLELIGIGLLFFGVTYVVHVPWHIMEMPAVGGIPADFWFGFFHMMQAASFFLATYGFYLFWKAGKQ